MRGRFNSGSGSKINGIIKEYVCGSDKIKAGDFVELSDSKINIPETVTQLLDNNKAYTSWDIQKINDNSFILFHHFNNGILYASVCEVNDNGNISINKVENLGLSVNNGSATKNLTTAKLSENKFIIVTISSNGMQGTICEIDSDSSIIVGTQTKLKNIGQYEDNNINNMGTINVLDNNKIFISYVTGYASDQKAGGVLCEINDNSISIIKDVVRNDELKTKIDRVNSSLVAKNKVLIVNEPVLSLFEINNDNLDFKTSIETFGNFHDIFPLGDNKALLIFVDTASSIKQFLLGTVCSVNNEEIILSKIQILDETCKYSRYPKMIKLDKNRIFVIAMDTNAPATDNNLSGTIISVMNNGIRIESSVKIGKTGAEAKILKLNENRILISFWTRGTDPKLNALILNLDIDSVKYCDSYYGGTLGIAKTSANKNEKIKVYVPVEN